MSEEETQPRRYTRSRTNRVFAGVCGGLGEYLDLDPTLVRVAWVIVTIMSVGLGLAAYVLLWLLAPEEGEVRPEASSESPVEPRG